MIRQNLMPAIFAHLMKRFIAFILILCHVNTSMLLPQVAENDNYDQNGQQIDDINTLAEYIDQVVLGNKDNTPEDEDDDNGQNFHLVKIVEYQCPQFIVTTLPKPFTEASIKHPVIYRSSKIGSVYFDILTPPPKV